MTVAQGQSEKPARRPQAPREIRELARRHSLAAIKSLAAIAINGKTEPARVAASKAILERAFGRPSQAMADESGDVPVTRELKLTDRERAKALAALIAKVKAAAEET